MLLSKRMDFLLYGANGYTGELIVRMAVERGLRPLLAGRNRNAVGALAFELGLDYRAFALDEREMLDAAIADVPVVLHAAGPFAHTSRPMVDACLRTATHYLDITGEVGVFEAIARRDEEAKAAGVMLLPGAGFDVVPSDCLAAHLKTRLPTAERLALAFLALSRVSRGTATTALEHMHQGGLVRRNGKLKGIQPGRLIREADFGRGPTEVVAIPWGDLSTAYYSTGIPNIETYAVLPPPARALMSAPFPFKTLLTSYPARRILTWVIRSGPPGPDEQQRAQGKSILWGEVSDAAGNRCISRLRTPEGYTLTALTALAIVERVRAGQAPTGFQTPSRAYGADFILTIEGCSREDVE